MNRKTKIATAAITGLTAIGSFAGAAHAAGIVLLPSTPNTNKVVSSLVRSKPGEYTVSARLNAVNWGSATTVRCSLWTDARESAGLSGWHQVADDAVYIGGSTHNFDGDIELDAVIDSTRRFKVQVRCNHTGGATRGNRPYIEPEAFTVRYDNPDSPLFPGLNGSPIYGI